MKIKICDRYVRQARVYPAAIGVLPIFVLVSLSLKDCFTDYEIFFRSISSIFQLLGLAGVASLATGYFFTEIFRETSKWLLQYTKFGKDGSEFPTTKLLLWRNAEISNDYHDAIYIKVKEEFGIRLPTREEEENDLENAKKVVVEVVRLMRQGTRQDKILRQYNIEFGFCRNCLGASVWSIVCIVAFFVINYFAALVPYWYVLVTFMAQIVLTVGVLVVMEKRALDYANCLLATFLSKGK